MGLSHTSGSLYGVVTTIYGVITTPFRVMPDINLNNNQIYLKWIIGVAKQQLVATKTN
jgi:hypothetical protein